MAKNQSNHFDPTERMRHALALRAESLAAEREAVGAALQLTRGNVMQAAIILEVSPAMLRRAIHGGKGARLADLVGLTQQRRGRPAVKPASIAKQAAGLPAALLAPLPALPKTKHK
jgi:hypothetical protein